MRDWKERKRKKEGEKSDRDNGKSKCFMCCLCNSQCKLFKANERDCEKRGEIMVDTISHKSVLQWIERVISTAHSNCTLQGKLEEPIQLID